MIESILLAIIVILGFFLLLFINYISNLYFKNYNKSYKNHLKDMEKKYNVPQRIMYECVIDSKKINVYESYLEYYYITDKEKYKFKILFKDLSTPYWKTYHNIYNNVKSKKGYLIINDLKIYDNIKKANELLKELSKSYDQYQQRCIDEYKLKK